MAGKPHGPGRERLDGMVLLNMSNVTAASERPLAPTVAPIVVTNSLRAALSGMDVRGTARDRHCVGLQRVVVLARHSRTARPGHGLALDANRVSTARVEPILREHLRRSPHDGEARMMLARALAGRGDLLGCARQLHEVPFWSPRKAEALFREGQSYLKIDRAKDAEDAWLWPSRTTHSTRISAGSFSRPLAGAA